MRKRLPIKSINRRFSMIILFSGILFGLLFSVFDGIMVFRSERKELKSQIEQIKQNHVPFLISGLWLTDIINIQKQVDSIASFSYISFVEVVDDEGNSYVSGNDKPSNNDKLKIPLIYTYKKEKVYIGTLNIYEKKERMKEIFIKEQLIHILEHIILTLLLTVLLIFFFNRMIGRHLRELTYSIYNDINTDFNKAITLEKKVKRDDEIDYLLKSLNKMRSDLKMLLDEKNMLLREVHHRIKNNISSVDNLLYLQSERISNTEGKKALKEAQSRLKSMLILYDKIYHSQETENIKIAEYFSPLIHEIIHLFYSDLTIKVEKNIQNALLPVPVVTALGILLNELITNSLKHAFSGKDSGTISVSIIKIEENTVELVYSDDGSGINRDITDHETPGLGMALIKSLVKRFSGTMDIANENGTHFTFLLHIDDDKQHY